jgi:hypothetical protein
MRSVHQHQQSKRFFFEWRMEQKQVQGLWQVHEQE